MGVLIVVMVVVVVGGVIAIVVVIGGFVSMMVVTGGVVVVVMVFGGRLAVVALDVPDVPVFGSVAKSEMVETSLSKFADLTTFLTDCQSLEKSRTLRGSSSRWRLSCAAPSRSSLGGFGAAEVTATSNRKIANFLMSQ